MEPSTLTPWRDLALMLLIIEAFLIVLVPAAAFFFAVKGVRAVKRRIRLPLLQTQVWALRIQHTVIRGTNAVASVPINIRSTATGASVTTRSLLRMLRGSRAPRP
jgi:hypothetical protein